MLQAEADLVQGILKHAAEHGYNAGTDEYEDNPDNMEHLWCVSNIFTIKEEDGDILGLIIIQPSAFCRGWAPSYSLFSIIPTRNLIGKDHKVIRTLAGIAERLAHDIYTDHVGTSVSVLTLCTDWIQQIAEQGFHISVCIPFAGILKGREADSYLLCKKYPDRDANNIDLNKKIAGGADYYKAMAEQYPADSELKQLPGLPIQETLSKYGVKVRFRNATLEDVSSLWAMMEEDIKSGQGYSLDDFPGDHSFHYFFITQYNLIIEDVNTGKILVYFGFKSLWPSRRKQNKLASTMVTVHPDMRGKGLHQFLYHRLNSFLTQVGFTGIMADMFLVNTAMNESNRKNGMVRVGIVPGAGVLEGHGLADSVLGYQPLTAQCSKM